MKSGAAFLEGLRDGRVVYVGGDRVEDVTTDSRFARAAQTMADLYDAKSAPENAAYTYEADGAWPWEEAFFPKPQLAEAAE